VKNRQRMSHNHTEANEFIKREIAVWGEDEIDYLIESGYVPVKLSTGKWSWLHTGKTSVMVPTAR
jgi:hypothetical protein